MGLRSAPLNWRDVGIWRPFIALAAALLVPSLLAWGLLSVAGTPGALEGEDWLRRNLLLMLYALAMAPFVAWLVLPLLWPVALIAVVRGWAGLLGALGLAVGIGVLVVHLALHGDLTTEDARVLPNLVVALAIQGTVGWAVFWGLMSRKGGQAKAATLQS